VSEANKIKNFNSILDYIAKNTSNSKASRKDVNWTDWFQRFNSSRDELMKHASSARPTEFQIPPGIVTMVNAIKTTGGLTFEGSQEESSLCVKCDFTRVPVSGSSQPPKVVMCRGFHGSVFEIPELGLARRPYRLVVLDPPFGWNLGGAEWDKNVSFLLVVLCPFCVTFSQAWSTEMYLSVFNQIKLINELDEWVGIVFADPWRVGELRATLSMIFNSFELFFWVKDGSFTQKPGSHLTGVVEAAILCYHHPQRGRPKSLYNYAADEGRPNNFTTSRYKLFKRSGGKGNVNPAQKSLELMTHLVTHFSRPGEWVLDLCSGTGDASFSCILFCF